MFPLILSVPHTGTHTLLNALKALGVKQRETFEHLHFMEFGVSLKVLDEQASTASHILIPLREPVLSFISKYRRMTTQPNGNYYENPTKEQVAMDYTVGNWAVMGEYLACLPEPFIVPMTRDGCNMQRLAHFLDVPYRGEAVEIGNTLGPEPSTKEFLQSMPGVGELIHKELGPANKLYDELIQSYHRAAYGGTGGYYS